MAKHELRKQLRHEKFNDRKNFYSELMSNPSTDKFYQLIRKNNGNRGHNVGCLIVNGKEINSAEDQCLAFADYYEDLSIPKDDGYDSAYLELCTVRHNMISNLCQESSETADPFTVKEVKESISKLNNT